MKLWGKMSQVRSRGGIDTMTGRERLLAVLSGKMPDRVPISTYELVGYNRPPSKTGTLVRPVHAGHPRENGLHLHVGPRLELRDPEDAITSAISWKPRRSPSRSTRGNGADREEDDRSKRTVQTPEGVLTSTAEVFDNVQTVWKTEHWCKSPQDVDKLLWRSRMSPSTTTLRTAAESAPRWETMASSCPACSIPLDGHST